MTIDLFYIVFRNPYIRKHIRNNALKGIEIRVDVNDLNSDSVYKHLALLSDHDKLMYNIHTLFSIKKKHNLHEYINHPHRHIISSLFINHYVIDETDYQLKEINFEFSSLGSHITKFEFYLDSNVRVGGQPPETITELCLKRTSSMENRRAFEILDNILSNLPSKLKKLDIPNNFNLGNKYNLPESLVDLNFLSRCSDLKSFNVPGNKVYKSVGASVISKEELNWLFSQTWISNISISGLPYPIGKNMIPPHTRALMVEYPGAEFDVNCLPPSLERLSARSLECTNNEPLSKLFQFSNLKNLYVYDMPKLVQGLLPISLEMLTLSLYNDLLEHSVLPPRLKILDLPRYDKDLGESVLPKSLTQLTLSKFYKRLRANVLPQGLKTLILYEFNNTIEPTALPTSLTSLVMYCFTGSFASITSPLSNLQYLAIHSLTNSISTLLGNIRKIEISFEEIVDQHSLQNITSIQHLILLFMQRSVPLSLPVGLLPPNIKHLSLINISINDANVIPYGCLYLEIKSRNLDTTLLPSSIKHIKYSKGI
ncbi:hypothetical protein CYY_003163 [Polysphondylium violaceum]|uniref:Uncharacterized protein n=1 Tax=Polysphondylium violaceum TaxID=133409 RepID=A0A8J4Q050_9MYCE|nr:hypothetical protein CYY_003163 [Polysphondylium violaceum]